MTITIICDNNPYKKGLETSWGFSCLVTGIEKSILFDTGPGRSLLGNMEKLAIDPRSIDTVVLSHIHGDHSGGLDSFLEKNADVVIYLPQSFPETFKDKIQRYGVKIVAVKELLNIREDVYTTGELGRWLKEQSLVVRTDKGLVIITGCAHPGIVKIVSSVRDIMKDDILLIIGGFHLEWTTKGRIEKIISAFKQMGVRYIGPAHCTGEKAKASFEKHFGRNYIDIGAGKVINF